MKLRGYFIRGVLFSWIFRDSWRFFFLGRLRGAEFFFGGAQWYGRGRDPCLRLHLP
jgi:hypothetical protein